MTCIWRLQQHALESGGSCGRGDDSIARAAARGFSARRRQAVGRADEVIDDGVDLRPLRQGRVGYELLRDLELRELNYRVIAVT
jgi:hypothetical protein